MDSSANRGVIAIVGLGAAATCAFAFDAEAADLAWDNAKQHGAVSVRERGLEAYRPDGIRIGNYVLYPEIGFKTTWNDNILDEPINRKRDLRYELDTAIKFESHFARHQLDVIIGGRAVTYQDHRDYEYIDAYISSKWRIDIDHGHKIFGSFSSELRHEEHIEEESPKNAKSPPQYRKTLGEIGFRREVGRVDAAIGTRLAVWDYKDTEDTSGNPIILDPRDVTTISPFLRLGYRFSPGFKLLAETRGRLQDNRGNGIVDRDARGIEALLGVEMELSPLVRLTFKGGYLAMDYLQQGLTDIGAPIWEGRVEWLVSPLLTLGVGTSRNVVSTSFGDSSGRLTTVHSVRADYEAWRNLIVTAEAYYRSSDYIGDSRQDAVWAGRVGLDYYHTKNWMLGLSYDHQYLTSTVSELDRRINRVTVEVKYRY